jgi:beta-N-acetylhexosaminidase
MNFLRLSGRTGSPPPRRDDLDHLDFEWPTTTFEPAPPTPPTPRRRRPRGLALVGIIALLLAGAATLAALIAGDDGQRPLTDREKRQLEIAAPGSSQQGRGASLAVPATVKRTAAGMALPRQVAQLFAIGVQPQDASRKRVSTRGWGGMVITPGATTGTDGAEALATAVTRRARKERLVRPVIAVEQAGGPASTFEDLPPRAQPLAGDRPRPAAVRRDARRAARALRRLGVRMSLAPVADVGVAAGPLQDRVFSDDAGTVTRMTRAAVRGWLAGGVAPAVGYFPGQGAASEDPDLANATVGLTLAQLRGRDLRPFAAVARRAPVVMTSNAMYAAWDGVSPAAVLPQVTRLLRLDLGFRGVVMTPDLRATAPVLGTGVGTAAVKALEAGADLLYVSGGPANQDAAYRAVLRAVRRGRISPERVRLSVQRVLALKRRQGLLPEAPRLSARKARARARANKSRRAG